MRAHEAQPSLVPRYRPVNLEAALNDTFNALIPNPIPIVGPSGAPLDWLKNCRDRDDLSNILPAQYQEAMKQRVKIYEASGAGLAAFSEPYQAPREAVNKLAVPQA
jgi:hypothetical protein